MRGTHAVPERFPRWKRLSVRCAGFCACDRFAQLLMEVAVRMWRQWICDTGLRLQAMRLKSIKQIEISRVVWKYHLPRQTVELIQMGTPCDREAIFGSARERGVSQLRRALEPGSRSVNAICWTASKILAQPFTAGNSLLWLLFRPGRARRANAV